MIRSMIAKMRPQSTLHVHPTSLAMMECWPSTRSNDERRRESKGSDSIRWRGYIFEIGFYKILNSASLPVQASERLHAGNPSQEPS